MKCEVRKPPPKRKAKVAAKRSNRPGANKRFLEAAKAVEANDDPTTFERV